VFDFENRHLSLIHDSYSALKKQIYIIEKENHRWRAAPDDPDSPEQATFLSRTENGGEAAFEHLLDRELKKITLFYHTQEKELLDQLAALESLIAQKEEEGPNSGYDQDLDDDDDDDDDLDDSRMAESGVFKPTRKSSNGGVG
jgi:phosphate transporter